MGMNDFIVGQHTERLAGHGRLDNLRRGMVPRREEQQSFRGIQGNALRIERLSVKDPSTVLEIPIANVQIPVVFHVPIVADPVVF